MSERPHSELEQRYRRLFAEHGPALARLAASYTRSRSDRDDLLQEIALALWQALPRFRGECSERTFLFRIAHNRCITHISQRKPTSVPVDDDLEIADSAPSPESDIFRHQQREQLLAAIRALAVPYREVITLTLEGMSYAEIADVLGIAENNVGVRLNRARQLLREMMEGTR